MKKYITDKIDDYSEHWYYCIENDLPFVRIIPKSKFSKVEFDIFTMLDTYELTIEPSDFIIDLYKNYAEFFMLPKDKIEYIGGSKALIFTIYKEHSEIFAKQLFEYLLQFVRKYRRGYGN